MKFGNITFGATPADLVASGVKIILTAHDTQAFGDVCTINSSGEAAIAKADAIANANTVVMCADASITANNAGNYLMLGVARNDTWEWATVGGLIYLTVTGTTGNTLTQVAPSAANNVIQVMGIATSADRMIFNPSLVQVEHA
jgi:hypothetical protein